jgi:DNA-binding SARP family transcriptional activator
VSPRCEIELLGAFQVTVDGRYVDAEAWRHRRGADLVKLLALSPSHRVHRDQILDAFWPDLASDAGGANLRKALHFARRALGAEEAIAVDRDLVTLWPSADADTDVERFERSAADAIRDGDSGACSDAADLAAAELLPTDRYEPWVVPVAERIRVKRLELLRLAGRWREVVEIDPLDEEAHRELIRAALDGADRLGAIRQFDRLRSILGEELGVAPEPETVELYERILAMEGHEPVTLGERARSLLDRGLVAMNRDDLEEAESEAREARVLAVEGGLGRELGEASALLGMIAHQRGNWMQVFRDEFVEVVRGRPELAGFVFEAHLCLAEFSLYGPGGHKGVAAFAQGLLEQAEKLESIHGRALATLMIGETELLSGRLAAAEDALSLAELLHREAQADSGRVLCIQRLAEVDVARERRDRAERSLRDALETAEGTPLSSHLVVRVYGGLIGASDGSAVLEEADAALHGLAVCEPCSMGYLVGAAKASAMHGDLAGARGYLDRAERIAGMWRGGAWQAGVWEARATLRQAEGDPAKAAALFIEAADMFASVGHPLAEARCRAAVLAAERS